MWKKYLILALALAPSIVSGIESIKSEAPGATKKQLAVDSLHLATTTALQVDPKDQVLIDATAAATSAIIEATVKDKNDSGEFVHTKAATA